MPPIRLPEIGVRFSAEQLTDAFEQVRESLAEWRAVGPDVDREVLFDTSGLRDSTIHSVVGAIHNPQMAELYRRYAEEEVRRRERLALCGMIRRAEEELWGMSPTERLVRTHAHEWRREYDGEWTNPNHERGEDDEGDHEGDGAGGGQPGRVGHGRGGYRGQGGGYIRAVVAPGSCWLRDIRAPIAEDRGVRPDGGPDRRGDADGRGITPAWYEEDRRRILGDAFRNHSLSSAANKRAEALLLEHLDEDQKSKYALTGQIQVTGISGREYLILTWTGQVICKQENHWYCLESKQDVPDEDWALAVKLWLEADEVGFLATANEFPLRKEIAEYIPRRADIQEEYARRQEDLQREYQERREGLQREHQERLSDLERCHLQEVEQLYARMQQEGMVQSQRDHLASLNCPCQIEIREPCNGPFHLDTPEQARVWLETHGLEYELVDLLGETTYTINGRPSDEHTWQLLMEADGR